jgi:hypothetical protein
MKFNLVQIRNYSPYRLEDNPQCLKDRLIGQDPENISKGPHANVIAVQPRDWSLMIRSFPVRLCAIVVVHALIVLPIPVPARALIVLRGFFKLILCKIDAVSAQLRVVI